MNQLISHIEFLLHTHDCVIVPALGGFVVNSTPSQKNGLSVFHSPACELAFNRELTHNDGLLVQSYMQTDGISFEQATQKIEQSAREIKSLLRSEKFADLGDLGSFKMIDEQRYIYQPKPFVRPEYFGLSPASLKPVIQVMPPAQTVEIHRKDRKSIVRKIGIGAAAAVIAAIMLIFPVRDSTFGHQTARMFSENRLFSFRTEKANINTPPISATVFPEIAQPNAAEITESASAQIMEESTASTDAAPKYYIVTGVYEVSKVAGEMIALLQSEGYTGASSIERSNRIDVYAASFSTHEEAEENLKQLRQNFPHHRDAWILER
ncbi:MAG: hypothetical protein Q4G48_01300 [Bacteroidia bacterium]|nr:hypothetical protein [Bacteroidia bacterium]